MDRRQRKTREAIFSAFSKLLGERDYNNITVQEIIDEADIGRATFYSHFETKDYLLKSLCEELFKHIIDTALGEPQHRVCTYGNENDSVFLHLLRHLQKNDRDILGLLSSRNNEMFLRYFKSELKKMILSQYAEKGLLAESNLPEDYLVNHISSSFVETVDWWISQKIEYTPEKITEYFLTAVNFIIPIENNN